MYPLRQQKFSLLFIMQPIPQIGKSDLDPRYTCFPRKGSEFENKQVSDGMTFTPQNFPEPELPERKDDIYVSPPLAKFDPVEPPDPNASPSIQKPPENIHSPTDSSKDNR